MYGYIFWGIILLLVVLLFGSIFFWKGRRKEYALYQADGQVFHVFRRTQNFWFDWPGRMIFEKEDGRKIIFGSRWYFHYEEIKEGEWAKIAEAQKAKQEKENGAS